MMRKFLWLSIFYVSFLGFPTVITILFTAEYPPPGQNPYSAYSPTQKNRCFFPKLVFQCLFKILFIPVVVHCFSLTHFNVSFADEKSNDDAIFCHGANLQMGDDVFDLENNAEVLQLSKGDWGVGEEEQMETGSE